MIGLSWNCRGLGHPCAVPILCELVRTHRPDVFLFDTLTHSNKIEEVRIRWALRVLGELLISVKLSVIQKIILIWR